MQKEIIFICPECGKKTKEKADDNLSILAELLNDNRCIKECEECKNK